MSLPAPVGFEPLHIPGSPGLLLVRKKEAPVLARALAASPAAFDRLAPVACRGKAWEFAGDPGGPWMVRRYVHGGLLGRLLGDLQWGWGRAIHELRVSDAARSRGLPTPEIVGIRGRKVFGPLWRLDLLTRKVEDGQAVEAFLQAGPRPAAGRTLARRLALFLRRMHDSGLVHADPHIRNFLVRSLGRQGDPEIVLLDLDRSRLVDRLTPAMADASLFRLNRSLEKFGVSSEDVSSTDRLRFLLAYSGETGPTRAPMRDRLKRCQRHLRMHRFWWKLCGWAS
ncbi:MAG: hypothetical protein HYU36_14765 [Planctomycetes bacterium]|nr:hypothetical protein [Planctomycetota bacterium]